MLNTTLLPVFNCMIFHQKWFIIGQSGKCELVDKRLNFALALDSLCNSPDLVYCSWEAESEIQLARLVN